MKAIVYHKDSTASHYVKTDDVIMLSLNSLKKYEDYDLMLEIQEVIRVFKLGSNPFVILYVGLKKDIPEDVIDYFCNRYNPKRTFKNKLEKFEELTSELSQKVLAFYFIRDNF